MRLRDIIALIALIAVALGGQLFRDDATPQPPTPPSENPRRPAPQSFKDVPWDADTQAWLSQGPAQSLNKSADWLGVGRDATIDIPKSRRSGTGTAFAVGTGAWLTARHVIDGCDDIGLQVAPKKGIRVTDVRLHPSADVALLRTTKGPAPFQIGDGTGNGSDGYMIGFPAGKPGAVHGRKIGVTMLNETGRYRTREPADVWSERSRVPDRFGSLGGLSGGPLFTGDGRISGVVLAEEPRRGRVFSAQPATLRALMKSENLVPAIDARPAALVPDTYPAAARAMLTSLRVAKVLCRVR